VPLHVQRVRDHPPAPQEPSHRSAPQDPEARPDGRIVRDLRVALRRRGARGDRLDAARGVRGVPEGVGERLRGGPGGILGLLVELEDHEEALEHDLVVAGWTLDDVPERLNWRALLAFTRQAAQQPGTALYRSFVGDDHVWGLNEQLLAAVCDA